MRIAIAYDCLYPYTIGGAEKWLRALAEGLSARHRVTYLTRRQWSQATSPGRETAFDVVAVSSPAALYSAAGRRRIWPPLSFGVGLFLHLARHGHRYDVVHVASFPFFALLGAALARATGGPTIASDWLEVWSREYWREYLGRFGGAIGAFLQRRCIRVGGSTMVHSALHARRLTAEGGGDPQIVTGLFRGNACDPAAATSPRAPLVVFVGRHIPEKRVLALPAALAVARREIPDLRAVLFGAGPDTPALHREVARLGLGGAVRCPGFVSESEIEEALRRATCLVLPSRREGFGLAIVEAAAQATPSLVTRAPESAATELIEDGENGLVVESAEPQALAAGLLAVHAEGAELRRRTRDWFARNEARLTVDSALASIEAIYAAGRERTGAEAFSSLPPGS